MIMSVITEKHLLHVPTALMSWLLTAGDLIKQNFIYWHKLKATFWETQVNHRRNQQQ